MRFNSKKYLAKNSICDKLNSMKDKEMKNTIESLVVGKYYQIENHIAICEMLNSTSNKKCLSRISGVGSVTAFYDEVTEVEMTPELLKECEARKNGTMNFIGSFNASSKYKGD
jgi:hypothetical protein